MRSRPASLLLLLVRLGLAGLFGFAAYVKLTDPQAFVSSVMAFKILPDHLVVLSTFVIPWIEAVVAILLLLGAWTRASALVLAALLIAFIAAIVSVLDRGMSVKCGCFGRFELFCTPPLSWCNVIQNSVLTAGTLALVVFGGGRWAIDAANARR